MSSTASDLRGRGQTRVGLVGKVLGFVSNIFVVLLLAMLTSIVIEWIGLSLWWKSQGIEHSREMVQLEADYIGNDLRMSLYGPAPKDIAISVAERVKSATNINMGISKYSTPGVDDGTLEKISRVGLTKLAGYIDKSKDFMGLYVESASNIMQVFSMRCVVILLSAPLFVLLVFAASIDGLVQRELRKAGGGREYGFVYHHLKSWFKWLFFLPMFVYLASPFATHPNYIIVPGAISVAILSFFISATFKKYL